MIWPLRRGHLYDPSMDPVTLATAAAKAAGTQVAKSGIPIVNRWYQARSQGLYRGGRSSYQALGVNLPASTNLVRILKEYSSPDVRVLDDAILLIGRTLPGRIPVEVKDIDGLDTTNDLKAPTQSDLRNLVLKTEPFGNIAQYFHEVIKSLPDGDPDIFQFKVGLKRIHVQQNIANGLQLHVYPINYWFDKVLNRVIPTIKKSDVGLQALQMEGQEQVLRSVLGRGDIEFHTPGAFFAETSLLTSDKQLVLFKKPPEGAYGWARGGRAWTCTLERGLLWKDIIDSVLTIGPKSFGQSLQRINDYLKKPIILDELRESKWLGFAVGGNLNTSVIGLTHLNITGPEILGRNPDPNQIQVVPLDQVARRIFRRSEDYKWHTTARLRALLTLRDQVAHTELQKMIRSARRRFV